MTFSKKTNLKIQLSTIKDMFCVTWNQHCLIYSEYDAGFNTKKAHIKSDQLSSAKCSFPIFFR